LKLVWPPWYIGWPTVGATDVTGTAGLGAASLLSPG
jgi:hypothetical protein